MFKSKNQTRTDERLDRFGQALIRRAASNNEEAVAASDQPFLYARVRARINEERARREAGESWLQLIGVAWRAVPAMLAVAVFAFVLFWSSGTVAPSLASYTSFSDEALLAERDAGVERVVFADRNALSNDEVLATILDEDGREAAR